MNSEEKPSSDLMIFLDQLQKKNAVSGQPLNTSKYVPEKPAFAPPTLEEIRSEYEDKNPRAPVKKNSHY